MSQKTTFIEKDKFKFIIKQTIDELSNNFLNTNEILSEDLSLMKNDSFHFINKLLSKYDKNDRCERIISRQILQSVYQSEILSAGASNVALQFCINFNKHLNNFPFENKNENTILNSFNEYMDIFKQKLLYNSTQAHEKDVKNIIINCCGEDYELYNVIWEAIKLGGLETKIFINNGLQKNYLIELKEGYNFNIKSYNFMLTNNIWERNECKILIVDGLVEKVSELDQILNKAFETNQPLVIIALGFSEEVVATLKTNMDRKILDVQPIRITTDLDALNMINDISTAAGCLPVSTMKGDLLAFTKWENLPTVDKILLSEKEISIENKKTSGEALKQIKMLLQKRQENYLYEDVQNIFDKRIKSLSVNSINIFLPDLSQINLKTKQIRIDTSLRNCKTIINYGITDFKKSVIDTGYKNEFEKIIYDSLLLTTIKNNKIPTLSAITGCMLIGKALLQLYLSSGFIKIIS